MKTVSERLRWAREQMGLSQRAFVEPLGLTQPSYNRWESGEVKLSLAHARMIEAHHKIRSEWLLTGERPVWVPDEPLQSMASVFLDRPHIEGWVACTQEGTISDPGPLATRYALRMDFAARILRETGGGSEKDLYFIRCDGIGMVPTVRPDEMVLVNCSISCRNDPVDGGIYLIRQSTNTLSGRLKRIRVDRQRGVMIADSDNPTYLPISISLGDTPLWQLILGRAVWVGRYLLDTDPEKGDW